MVTTTEIIEGEQHISFTTLKNMKCPSCKKSVRSDELIYSNLCIYCMKENDWREYEKSCKGIQ